MDKVQLRRLLYKGGACVPVHKVDQAIELGFLGNVQPDRVVLVSKIHEAINGMLVSGGSDESARRYIVAIGEFFKWADQFSATVNLTEIVKTYIDWSDHLWQRANVVKDLKKQSAYDMASKVGNILDRVLERATPLAQLTRLRRVTGRKTPRGAKADKQNLADTFAFGHLMQDICDAISISVIRKEELVRIPLQQGGEITYGRTYFSLKDGRPSLPAKERLAQNVRTSMKSALAYIADQSLNHTFRRAMVNLRIQAEMFMFIGQTGMNLAQAQNIQLTNFSFINDIDGYQVKEYKRRRAGEVLFKIFSEYRHHFERYLDWRREFFPNEKRLFPLIRQGAREDSRPKFRRIEIACKGAGIAAIPPSMLRGTRVNWLLRRSRDPKMTAEISGHSEETLLAFYEIPSQQKAFSEVIQFHWRNDPILASQDLSLAVAPGQCDGTPVVSQGKPETAPEPDCIRPSGCLWCEHHRDIDSLHYVWSIASFRHLKIIELSRQPPTKDHKVMQPAEHGIKKLSEKLTWFRDSNATRREWVEEALARVEEGNYSDQWSHFIEAMEGSFK